MSRSICSVDGCGKVVHGHGLCGTHRMRMRRRGHLNDTKRPNGSGTIMKSGHVSIRNKGVIKYEHVIVAEKALGRELPNGAQVHHVNLDPSDNRPSNLVICPDDSYHKLLHKRLRAYEESGNANYRQCHFCHQYDDPQRMFVSNRTACHRECRREYENKRYHEKTARNP